MPDKAGTPHKTIVIGLDGATLDLILPWAQEGRLPALQRIIEEGTIGELRSTIQPLTAPAWISFMTGMNPGKHGLYDFVRRRIGNYKRDIMNASHRSGKSIWKIISENGKRVCVINVPMTYPPEKVNGYLVSGILQNLHRQLAKFGMTPSDRAGLIAEGDKRSSATKSYLA